jgi:hypothetical protein
MSSEVPPGYEQFWVTPEKPQVSDKTPPSWQGTGTQSARTPGPELTDGQISVAAESDLLQLIDSITQELSRTTSGATSLPDLLMHDMSRTTSDNVFGSMLDFPPRASSHSDRHLNSLPAGIPPRSSTGMNPRATQFSSRLGTTFEESASAPIEFPSLKPMRLGTKDSFPSPQRLPSNRTESTGSRTLSGTSAELDPLPQVLHALDNEPDDCIVVVRRITRLGFKSNRIIKARFEQIGWVVRNVVLLPSRSRPAEGSPSGATPHARPSSMGFVVFMNPHHAKACLDSKQITIDGVDVLVQPFTRQYKPTSGNDGIPPS